VYRVSAVLSADVELRENGTAAAYLEQAELTGDRPFSVDKLYWTYTPKGDSPFLPREGERVTFTGRLYAPPGRQNPYGFDFRMYLLQKGVTAGISGATDVLVTDHPGRGLASVIYGIRKSLEERLRLIFGEESPLPEALLLGQKSNLPEETKQVRAIHVRANSTVMFADYD
jgi:predicted membrane metal-binding protein